MERGFSRIEKMYDKELIDYDFGLRFQAELGNEGIRGNDRTPCRDDKNVEINWIIN